MLALALAALFQSEVYPRPEATFWSAPTGPVKLFTITGDSVQPFRVPRRRITIFLADASKVAVFRRLIRSHAVLARATIDDAGDGEYYAMRKLVVTGYTAAIYGASHPGITLTFDVFHMRCGPPTCTTPLAD